MEPDKRQSGDRLKRLCEQLGLTGPLPGSLFGKGGNGEGSKGMSMRGGLLLEAAVALVERKSRNEVARSFDLTKNTVCKLARHLSASLPDGLRCACGRELGHGGWCPPLYAKSEKRQASMAAMHARAREAAPRREDADDIEWFEALRWGGNVACPFCFGVDVMQVMSSADKAVRERDHRWRCRGCARQFSVRTGTPMAHTGLSLAVWRKALGLLHTNPHHIARECGIGWKAARDLMRRAAPWALEAREAKGKGYHQRKLCMCGCGEPAPIATSNDYLHGIMAGEPRRYIMGHHTKRHPAKRDRCGLTFTERAKRGTEAWQFTKATIKPGTSLTMQAFAEQIQARWPEITTWGVSRMCGSAGVRGYLRATCRVCRSVMMDEPHKAGIMPICGPCVRIEREQRQPAGLEAWMALQAQREARKAEWYASKDNPVHSAPSDRRTRT